MSSGDPNCISYASVLKASSALKFTKAMDTPTPKDGFFGGSGQTYTTLFEEAGLKTRMTIYKAEKILQAALDPDNVIMELPTKYYITVEELYEAIEEAFGPVVGIAPLVTTFRYYRLIRGNESALKAINDGVTIEGINYKATPAQTANTKPVELIRVHLRNVPNQRISAIGVLYPLSTAMPKSSQNG
ncbi:hypothetical protein DM01DRAFT_1337242 [Hesseltinella vesiculosa]|uniref:Uncharacterized protein n=1 Tax=Hesseltinella vesiculosa TaxID=101127 RepID=A0A1X2GD64_9FUNG|nr:hypothetical protein DM01DRAFT_1337242 [Hesseltinella vesiculosa]